MEKILEIVDFSVQFSSMGSTVYAVNNLNLELEEGSSLGIVGETGAGKTTLAKSILRLIQCPPGKFTSGYINYQGKNILELNDKEMRAIRGKEISMIFQDPMTSLNPVMTIGDQIAEVIRCHEKLSNIDSHKKAVDMLEMVGISGQRAGDYPNQFSGGMKQRVIIAIALACNPNLLIADEPTTALDVTIQAQVLSLIKSLRQKMGTSMLLITHDLGVVAQNCDNVAIMYAGEIVEYGTIRQIFANAKHPYTLGLFGSVPSLFNPSARLIPIKGSMPDPTNLPKGCIFNDRCPKVMDICKREKPEINYDDNKHMVKCFLYSKKEVML